jgi:D-glycero-D-manno-heptose 1,7-bisphosphate phosphatase
VSRWPEAAPGAEREPLGGVPGPVLFLDRDGVLIEDRHYLHDPEQVVLLPGVVGALAAARTAGFRLVGLSNQSGLGRGYFDRNQLDAVMRRLTDLLAAGGVALDFFFYCPHAPRDGCRCRKPATGLLDEARAWLRWRAEESWLVGDKLSDVQLARNAGLGAVLVRTGYGAGQETELDGAPDVRVVDGLPAAVAAILGGAPR